MSQQEQPVMIRLENVGKEYRLGQVGHGTLREDLQSWWAVSHGREDPNRQIGQVERLEGDHFIALRGVNLEVRRGERLGIIGENGAGKSTLLKLISRITAPTCGSLDLYGRVTSMLEVGTGFNGEMTGRENIYLNGAILGMSKKEIDRRMDEIIEFSEVGEFIDTPVKRYSSGMYVKLAFSVAAHLNSEIVIMDEVLAVGDMAFQRKCIRKMLQTSEDERRTILFVSHNMETIRQLCDRCLVLSKGRPVFDGPSEEAISRYIEFMSQEGEDAKPLSERERRSPGLTGLCRIHQLQSLDAVTSLDGAVRFQLDVVSQERLDRAQLRLVVTGQGGGILGMSYSDSFLLTPGENRLEFRFPTGPLAPGRYSCDLGIVDFAQDVQRRHDFLRGILSFEIQESRMFFGQSWNPRSWGSVLLPRTDAKRTEE